MTSVRLGDIASLRIGRTPPRGTAQYWEDDGASTPWVTIGDMIGFGQISSTAEQVSGRAAQEIFRRPAFQAGTLLMSFKLSIGRTSVLGLPAYFNEAIVAIDPHDGRADKDYLRFALPHVTFSSLQDRAIKGFTLNLSKLRQLELDLPPLKIQQTIARQLTRILDHVEAARRELCLLRELSEHAYAAAFQRVSINDALLSQASRLPLRRLSDVATLATGTTPDTTNAAYYGGSVPLVKTAEILDDEILVTSEHLTESAISDCSLRVYPSGTVLMAMYGQGKTRGRVAILRTPAAVTQNTAAIEVGPELLPDYLFFYLLSQYQNLRRHGSLGHLSHLNLGYLRHMTVPVPPLSSQRQMVSSLNTIRRAIRQTSERNQLLEEVFVRVSAELTGGTHE